MNYILYGLYGNEWTVKAREMLDDVGVSYEVVEEFDYSRLEDGSEASPYMDSGIAYISRIPTLYIIAPEERYWCSGLEDIKGFCESRVRACS
jgi:hypothetical protein